MSFAFTWHRPATLAEAFELGERFGAEGAYLAGGTELIPDYRRSCEAAAHLISLEGIPGLRGIRRDDGQLRIGALTTIAELAASPEVRTWLPALRDASASLGSPQVRSLATVGGNFCRAVPCADLPPVAIVGGARLRLAGGGRERELDAAAFFVGPRQTVLERGEILLEVVIPVQPPHSGASYQRFARRGGAALAVASVAARLVLQDERIAEARIALGAVAPSPRPASRAEALLRGETLSPDLFALAAASAADEAQPITDQRGTAELRRELVGVLTRRALQEAFARALAGSRADG